MDRSTVLYIMVSAQQMNLLCVTAEYIQNDAIIYLEVHITYMGPPRSAHFQCFHITSLYCIMHYVLCAY